ncbi:hypothetical protein BDQ12DRAFT_289355 [Crucibulum laeve]|uniref:Lysine decarboxylase-like protein n=1 Tax=Crucibulum laeve TaxID=68775 RepID=A0A5C3MB91_9AGAR|nr:hypothetical protein BDQ12DRAFT_289355 [Crucibulum laeve]
MPAVAVYCGASYGKHQAYTNAAVSLGRALAAQNRPLIYGGGAKGIMGVVSGAVLEGKGKVTGIVPFAMVAAGGEQEKSDPGNSLKVVLDVPGREAAETIVVNSMHERKVEMAKRADGFIGLPGGFGTFEEVLEVTTWTQLGIHNKPVVLLNVRRFWEPLRQLIKNSIEEGYIKPSSEHLIVFVDGPESLEEHDTYDWGTAGLKALDEWQSDPEGPLFNWLTNKDGEVSADGKLAAT